MKAVDRGWTIVLVGAWNPAILSPHWIGQHLLRLKGDEPPAPVEVSIPVGGGSSELQLSFSDHKFLLVAQSGRVLFSPLARDDETLNRTETLAIRLLQTLGHTPVSAVGVNYLFRHEGSLSKIDELFAFPDAGRLVANDLRTVRTEILRRLEGITECGQPILNLKFSSLLDSGSIQAEFNYHYSIGSAEEAATRLEGAFLALAKHAAELLANYGAEIEKDGEEDSDE